MAMKAGVSAELLFLAGGGEMGERTRAMDWSGTAVGSPAQWPQSLKTAVSICLGSRHPMVLWWGRSAYTQFYNDAYISFLGKEKHPAFWVDPVATAGARFGRLLAQCSKAFTRPEQQRGPRICC